MNKYGVCKATRIEITDGIYEEQITLDDITGLSSTNTLKITSAPGNKSNAVIQYRPGNTTNWTVKLKDVTYVTLNSLTIKSYGSGLVSRVIVLDGKNDHITIENDSLIANTAINGTNTYSESSVIFNDGSAKLTNCIIRNNVLLNGCYGIFIYGNSRLNPNTNISIVDNRIFNYYSTGMDLRFSYNSIVQNNFLQDLDNFYSTKGINLDYCDTSIIDKNEIVLGGWQSSIGIRQYWCIGSVSKPSLVTNNIIVQKRVGTERSSFLGLYLGRGTENIIAHNTIKIDSRYSAGPGYCAFMRYDTLQKVKLYNNNFVNVGTNGNSIYSENKSINLQFDHNNYYSHNNEQIRIGGTNYSIQSMQNTYYSDTNSLSILPNFISNLNLRLTDTSKYTLNKGKPIREITLDIDGEERDSVSPYIGADEYIPVLHNMKISSIIGSSCGKILDSIGVEIINKGSSIEKSLDIVLKITGDSIKEMRYTYNGNLQEDEMDTVYFKTFNTFNGGLFHYFARCYTIGDLDSANDTVSLVNFTVFPKPNNLILKDTSICEMDTGLVNITAKGLADVVLWYKTNESSEIISYNRTLSTLVYKTDTFFNRVFNYNGCYSDRMPIIVEVNRTLPPIISGDTLICEGGEFSLTVNSNYENLTWYDSINKLIKLDTGKALHGHLTKSTTFIVQDSGLNGCIGEQYVTVMVDSLPNAPFVRDTSICNGDSIALVANGTGSNIHWFDSIISKKSIYIGDTFITKPLFETRSYFVKEINNGCLGKYKEVLVNVYDIPSEPNLKDTFTCRGSDIVIKLDTISGNYNWFNLSMKKIYSGDSLMLNHLKRDTSFYINKEKNGCISSPKLFEIKTIDSAVITLVNGDEVCSGEKAQLSVSSVADVFWYSDSLGNNLLGSSNNYISLELASNTSFYVQAGSGKCNSKMNEAKVIVKAKPDASFIFDIQGGRIFYKSINSIKEVDKWVFPNETFSGVKDFFKDYSQNDTFKVTHILTDTLTNCSDTIIKVIELKSVSITNIPLIDVKIYPNPNSGLFYVDLGSMKEVNIKLFTNTGQLLMEDENLNEVINIDMKDKPSGIYFIEISNKGTFQRYKIIKN